MTSSTKKKSKQWAVPIIKKATFGFVKTDMQASVILVTIIAILAALSVNNFVTTYKSMKRIHPSKEDMKKLQQMMFQQATQTKIVQSPHK